jgi:hypothetical protein
VAAGVPPRARDEPLWGTHHGPGEELGLKGCVLGLLGIVGIGLLIAVVTVYFY